MKRSELFLWIVLVFIGIIFCMSSLIEYEDRMFEMEDLIKEQNEKIDSLQSVIDTLEWQTEIYDMPLDSDNSLLSAMIFVESAGNDAAWNESEKAAGCLQIRPVMVREVNRILKMQGLKKRYEMNDRWDRDKSIEMFYVWKDWHHPTCSDEVVARCWNGGGNGYRMTATEHYWNKVQDYLES